MMLRSWMREPPGSLPSSEGHHWVGALTLLLMFCAIIVLLATCPVAGDGGPEGPLPLGQSDDDRGPVPSMSVELTPDELEAVVSEAQLGAVNFDGTVSVEQSYITSSTVTLQGSVDSGWPCVISTTTFECTGPSDLQFQVAVIVPPAASCEIVGTVHITAVMKIPGLSPIRDEDDVIVTVAQYCNAEVWSNGRAVEVRRNEDASFELFILNTGNGPTTYVLDTSQVPDGVLVTFSTDELEVGYDENLSFEVNIKIDGAKKGIHIVVIRVTALDMEGGSVMSFAHPIQLKVESFTGSMGSAAYVIPVIVTVVAVVAVVAWKQGRLAHLDGLFKRFRDKDSDGGGEDGYLSSEAEDNA